MSRRADQPSAFLASLSRGRRVAARIKASVEDNRPPESIDPAHRDALLEGLAELDRGEYAPDEAVEAIHRRAGL